MDPRAGVSDRSRPSGGDQGVAPAGRAALLPASVKNVEQIRSRHRAEEVHGALGCRNPLEATWLRVRDPATDGEVPAPPSSYAIRRIGTPPALPGLPSTDPAARHQ